LHKLKNPIKVKDKAIGQGVHGCLLLKVSLNNFQEGGKAFGWMLLLRYNHMRLSAESDLTIKWRRFLTNSRWERSKLNSHTPVLPCLSMMANGTAIKGQRRGKLDIIVEILLFCEHQKPRPA
jgi:hypothetical protein